MSSTASDDIIDFLNNQSKQDSVRQGMVPIVCTSDPVTVKANVELFDNRLQELGINMAELYPLFNVNKNALIDATAGAGKTTALILMLLRGLVGNKFSKVIYVNTPTGAVPTLVTGNILVSTFLNSGAEEVQLAFREWQRKLNIVGINDATIKFSTLHSEASSIFKHFNIKLNINESINHDNIRYVMSKYGIRSADSTSNRPTIDEVGDVAAIFSYARSHLDEKRYSHPLMSHYGILPTMVDEALNAMKIYRQDAGVVDFGDLTEMVLEAAKANPVIKEHLENKYDYIFLDEAQDTAQDQYAMLRYYFPKCKVVFMGDVDQIIYTWRGSDGNIMLKHFVDDSSPEILTLSTNYRCGSNILDFVKPSIQMNKNRLPKVPVAYNQGGEVVVGYDLGINELGKRVVDDVVNQKSVSIIARTNQSLLVPALLLELEGTVDFSLSGSVSMDARLPLQVFGTMDLITKSYSSRFKDALRLFIPRRYDWNEADTLVNVLYNNKQTSLYDLPLDDIKATLPNLYPIILGLREAKKKSPVEAFKFLLKQMQNISYKGTSIYAQNGRDLVNFLHEIVNSHSKVKEYNIFELETLFSVTLPQALANRKKYSKGKRVRLTTVHDAKGKEWDSVYIWNAVQGAFPNTIGGRDLTEDEMEEERRTWFIACTRAKSSLTVLTYAGRETPFLRECDNRYVTRVEESTPYSHKVRVFDKLPDVVREMSNVDTRAHADRLLTQYIEYLTSDVSTVTDALTNLDIVQSFLDRGKLAQKVEELLILDPTLLEQTFNGLIETLNYWFYTWADELYRNSMNY